MGATEKLTMDAELRTESGKGATRRLRHDGKVAGIIYGAGKDPVTIQMKHHLLQHVVDDEGFSVSIMDLNVAGTVEQVILKDLQRHPAQPRIMHVDFQRIAEDQPITVRLPLTFSGQSKSAGLKLGGILDIFMVDAEISCLPKHLPSSLDVSVEALNIGEAIHLSGITLPDGVSLTALSHGNVQDHDQSVVMVSKARAGE
jgi:large subunit ribosomal protein L25